MEPSETSHALPFSRMPPQWGRVSIQFKYSLADEDWEAKACQQFLEVASTLMRCGAPELTLTVYVQLTVGDGASGSGSAQLEFAFSKTQLQDCLARLASAIMDYIKVFLVSVSGGSTLQVQYIIRVRIVIGCGSVSTSRVTNAKGPRADTSTAFPSLAIEQSGVANVMRATVPMATSMPGGLMQRMWTII
ncbi:hypothetical protein GB937_003458 [Aspergillus fischeri]|nr:hypothetical protein GB937_003458 [Aspergillus fischeri]